jgi:hypothetical protein
VYNTYPTASLIVHYQLPTSERVELRLASFLAPAINRINSLLTEQIQGTFGAILRRRVWAVTVEGGFGQSLNAGPFGEFSLVLAQAKVAYKVTKVLDLEAGALGSWQKVGAGNVPTTQELAFVAMTVHGAPLRF